MDLFDIAIARKLSSGGSGGGSAEPLILSLQDSYLNKTYQEIYDAVMSGQNVFLEEYGGLCPLSYLFVDEGYCSIMFSNATSNFVDDENPNAYPHI